MSIEVVSLWETAGQTMDGDLDRRQFIEARLAAAKVWRVLAGASSKADFDTRKFLVRDHLEAAANNDPRMLERLEASLDEDFEVLHQARVTARRIEAEERRNLNTKTHDTDALRAHIKRHHKGLDASKSWQDMWYDHYDHHHSDESRPEHTHMWKGTGKVASAELTLYQQVMASFASEGREWSQEERDKAKSEGHTLPGTDKFPIENAGDLAAAKNRIGTTNEPKSKVVNYIDERAKELGKPGVGKKSVRHTAPGGGEHAPYRIEEDGGKFYVVNDKGERKNKDGYSSKEEARDYQKALYVNVPGAAESAKEDEGKKESAYQPDWETRAYNTLSDNGKSHPPHKLPRRPADDEGDWDLLRPDMHHLIHEHDAYPEAVFRLDQKTLEKAHDRHHKPGVRTLSGLYDDLHSDEGSLGVHVTKGDQSGTVVGDTGTGSVKVKWLNGSTTDEHHGDLKRESLLRHTAALDPTTMSPGDSVTVHYHTDGQSGTCPATFTGPVDDTDTDPADVDPAAGAAPVASTTSTRKKAAFPPKADAPPADPSQAAADASTNAAPETAAGITYAFDYANGTFYVTDDGTGQWVDPAGSTFTFSAGDGGDEPEEPEDEEAEEAGAEAADEGADTGAPPWLKKSVKTAAIGDRVQRRHGDNDPDRESDSWVHEGPVGTVMGESPNGFGAHVRWDDGTESHHSWLELGLKAAETLALTEASKTAVGTNPFLPGANPFSGANPYTTPTPPGPDAAADIADPMTGDQGPGIAPVAPPDTPAGTPAAGMPQVPPVTAPGGTQRVPTTPQPPPPKPATASVSVVCTACGTTGEVSLSRLSQLVRDGRDLGCPKCGSIEVDAMEKTAEDFSQFETPPDPNHGTGHIPPADLLHDTPSVKESIRCSSCFTVFPHTAANPNEAIPSCPNCGSRATTVAGGWDKGRKLQAMTASIRTANPFLPPAEVQRLAERALTLAGG